MDLSNKKILVTGADGFIGSHLTEHLVSSGYNVRAFCQYNSFGSLGWLDSFDQDTSSSFETFLGDIRDPYGVKKAMEGCEVVLHLAALIAIPYSYHSPATYIDTNITGTLNVLQAGRELGVSRIVHTSTSETYGSAQFVPISEDHPLVGQSPYSASKIGADQMALSFHKSFDTPVTVLRPFNTYGPRQSARAVIPTIISQIAAGERVIKLGSISPTRDFTFVTDTAKGFADIAACDAAIGEVVNIGSNFEISIGDTVGLIAKAMGAQVEIITDEQRIRPEKSEVERLWADTSKAKSLFGWNPQYGDSLEGFHKGIEKTIEWFTQPANRALYKHSKYNI